MRLPWVAAFVAVASLAGCYEEPIRLVACGAPAEVALFFQPDGTLAPQPPAADAAVAGNGFSGGFLTDGLATWLSAPVDPGLHLEGEVGLEYWVEESGAPAPLVVGGGPGEAYRFFNQFGSDRAFQPGYAVEYGAPASRPGDVTHYLESLPLPPGGFNVETGGRVRVLLTGLALELPEPARILVGPSHPSAVRFEATCFPEVTWMEVARDETPVSLPFHQGLLTGQVPATEGLNQRTVPFTLEEATERLTIQAIQTGDRNPVKDDIDAVLVDGAGRELYAIGSPFADETGILWASNLEAIGMAPGPYAVRVDSYSGHGYTGTVVVTQEKRA